MKKMLVLLMVLAVAVFANAQLVETVILDQLAGPPPGDYQGIPSYEPSTWLLIGLVPHDYNPGQDPFTGIARMKLDLIAATVRLRIRRRIRPLTARSKILRW